jgi:uncharacterized BrkB/YihY/UPF0761 family membrane protein
MMLFNVNLIKSQKLGIYTIIGFMGSALILLIASIIGALNTLLLSNQSPFSVLPLFSLLFLSFGIIYLISGLGANLFYFISKYRVILNNKIGK